MPQSEREARRAQALRDNLKRRKSPPAPAPREQREAEPTPVQR